MTNSSQPMETEKSIVKTEVKINAPAISVWDALVNPVIIKEYMMGTEVISDWQEGSDITWRGEFDGKEYEDHGEIFKIEPYSILQYSHLSAGDLSKNYHIVTVKLSEGEDGTIVSLAQDNNPDEKSRKESQKNWNIMLGSMKKLVEGVS